MDRSGHFSFFFVFGFWFFALVMEGFARSLREGSSLGKVLSFAGDQVLFCGSPEQLRFDTAPFGSRPSVSSSLAGALRCASLGHSTTLVFVSYGSVLFPTHSVVADSLANFPSPLASRLRHAFLSLSFLAPHPHFGRMLRCVVPNNSTVSGAHFRCVPLVSISTVTALREVCTAWSASPAPTSLVTAGVDAKFVTQMDAAFSEMMSMSPSMFLHAYVKVVSSLCDQLNIVFAAAPVENKVAVVNVVDFPSFDPSAKRQLSRNYAAQYVLSSTLRFLIQRHVAMLRHLSLQHTMSASLEALSYTAFDVERWKTRIQHMAEGALSVIADFPPTGDSYSYEVFSWPNQESSDKLHWFERLSQQMDSLVADGFGDSVERVDAVFLLNASSGISEQASALRCFDVATFRSDCLLLFLFDATTFYSRYRILARLRALPAHIAPVKAAPFLAKKLIDMVGLDDKSVCLGQDGLYVKRLFLDMVEELRADLIQKSVSIIRRALRTHFLVKAKKVVETRTRRSKSLTHYETSHEKAVRKSNAVLAIPSSGKLSKTTDDLPQQLDVKKDARMLLLHTKTWMGYCKAQPINKAALDTLQREIATLTTRLFAKGPPGSPSGSALVDAVKAILLAGRNYSKREGDFEKDLDDSLQKLMQAVRSFITVCTESAAAKEKASSPASSPPPRPKSRPPQSKPAPPAPAASHKNLLQYFESKAFRESTSTYRQTSSIDIVTSLLERMSDELNGVPRKIHVVGLKMFSSSFTAKSCVIWLVKNHYAPTAVEAAKIFAAIIADGIVVELQKDPIQLSSSVFRWASDGGVTTAAASAEPVPSSSNQPQSPLMSSPSLRKFTRGLTAKRLNEPKDIPEWTILLPVSGTLGKHDWDPLNCSKCGTAAPSGQTRQCPSCNEHLFRNKSGKPLRLMIQLVSGYHYELGCRAICSTLPALDNQLQLEDWMLDYPLFDRYLSSRPHALYVADPDGGKPMILAVEIMDRLDVEEMQSARVLVWTEKSYITTVTHPTEAKEASERLKMLQALPAVSSSKLRWVKEPKMTQEMVEYERKLVIRNYKFGVLLLKENQKTEAELYGNDSGSEYYEDFLNLLGTRVRLAEHKGFRGGLDCSGENMTGEFSVYQRLRFNDSGAVVMDPSFVGLDDVEVMFHVSSMLPRSDEEQQLLRKRHLGNDVVVVVFREFSAGKTVFDPSILRSQFNHVAVVVTPCKLSNGRATHYHVQIACRPGVKPFRPFMPDPAVFASDEFFRVWLLIKLINAERAAMHAKDFAMRNTRTRKEILLDMQQKYWAQAKN